MAKKSRKSATGSARKKAKLRKTLSVVISIIILAVAIAWYFGGKPVVEVGAEGVALVQTEEPLVSYIPEILSGEYPPQVEYAEGQGIPEPAPVVPEPVEGQKKSSANNNISSAADLGHPENNPLFFGNPTDALEDTSLNTNYLMVKPQFTLSYNTQTLCPNWVAWHLDSNNMGDADRSDDFRPDTELPAEWYAVKKADYQYNKYGFDRGHVCPSADRTATKEDNSMTFLMTNMVPQTPDNNRVIWMHFENYERELVNAGNEVYIIAGPYGTGGTTPKGTFDNIPITLKSGDVLYMNVPAYTWKVLIAIPDGTDDLTRIDSNATVIAINVPNQTGMQKTGDWEQFLCSIDDIEAQTGYDFFELLPDDIEDALEKVVYNP